MARAFSSLIDAIGGIRLPSGAGAGKVITSDASGNFSWGVVSANTNVKQAIVDVGLVPRSEISINVVDATVTPTSRIIGQIAAEAVGGKQSDEAAMDNFYLTFEPKSGSFDVTIYVETGVVYGEFKINYMVG